MEHDKVAPQQPKALAPWWMDGETLSDVRKEPAWLIDGLNAFWRQVKAWLLWPLSEQDPLTCSERVLSLIAWERGVDRLIDEPLSLYRMRVKFAWENFQDAGSGVGFQRIFERLGLGSVTITERLPDADWDVINIELTDNAISENQALIAAVIRLYGRTCRRYRYEVSYPVTMQVSAGAMHYHHQVYLACL